MRVQDKIMYTLAFSGMALAFVLISVESTTTKYYILATVILLSLGSVAVALTVKEYRDRFKKYYLYILGSVALFLLAFYFINVIMID